MYVYMYDRRLQKRWVDSSQRTTEPVSCITPLFLPCVCMELFLRHFLCYFNLDFFETSAKCDDNISLVFKQFGNNYSSLLCTVCMYVCMYVYMKVYQVYASVHLQPN